MICSRLLQTLDLNRNRLTGTLQPLKNLTKLIYIDLVMHLFDIITSLLLTFIQDNNLLSGSIPDFFGQFSNLR